jgi:plasmanylethanolamine desaturase
MRVAFDEAPHARLKSSGTPSAELPGHDDFGFGRRVMELTGIASAVLLLAAHSVRLPVMTEHEWWLTGVFVIGAFSADFASGLVHWTADTWGRETLPLIGRRLLRPFRVHHVNPDDFTRRGFLDVNGDVATIVVFLLLAALFLPLDLPWARITEVFLFSFCLVGLPTNQVHQWAHMRTPPPLARFLQRTGIILSRAEHSRHHVPPYAQHYCIATGWCNRVLTAIDFFPRLERVITALTGLEPRADDDAFQASVSANQGATKSHD